MTADPFGADRIRERVLAGWAASPARFREDANAEEDLALGGYRDRVLVELAQNAADAAARAAAPGRLLLAVRELGGRAVLVAANTGAGLDAAGVQALATLRASAKREGDTVGRFGVGFAATLAVSDEPAVLSRSGGIRFSAADTRNLVREAAAASPELAEELTRRDGGVPVLRLPFPAEGEPPAGYDTAVLLPLRDAAAEELVLRLLAGVDDGLLLALPALDGVLIEPPGEPARRLADVGSRWHVLRREGRFTPAELADRPTEERARPGWQLAWALPRTAAGTASADPPTAVGSMPGTSVPAVPRPSEPAPVLHAPTPSDEPLPWPAVLVAGFPLDPGRRHVAPGPATDALVRAAAKAFVDLLVERSAAGDALWPMLPPPGPPAGVLDGALRAAVADLLPGAPLLPAVEDADLRLRGRDAVTLEQPAGSDPGVLAALAPWLADLVLGPRAAATGLRALGVRVLTLADVVESLPQAGEPARWRSLYAALAGLADDPRTREALAALPVPLVDGRVVRGPRGTVVLTGGTGGRLGPDSLDPAGAAGPAGTGRPAAGSAFRVLGVRAVDPEAAHPLLERLGAVPAGPRAVLDLPAVRAAVQASADADDPAEISPAVLDLVRSAVAAGELAAGDLGWLGELALEDDTGQMAPAAALALPGSAAAGWFDPGEIGLVDPALVERWGPATLAAVGVLTGPGLVRAHDVVVLPGADAGQDVEDLEGWDEWCELVADRLAAAEPVARLPAADPGTAGQVAGGWVGPDRPGSAPGRLPPGPDDPMPAAPLTGRAPWAGADVPVLPELLAVRDLDAVRPGALPEVVAAIAADPRSRPALVGPARVLAAGRAVDVLPYTAWWLRDRLGAAALADPAGDPRLAALLPPAPGWLRDLDAQARRALGVAGGFADLDAGAVPWLLARLADPAVDVPPAVLVKVLARLAELAAAGARARAPDRVRGFVADAVVMVPADEAVVLDAPMYAQRADLGAGVPVPPALAGALADLLDLPLASELAGGHVEEEGAEAGVPQPVPAAVASLLPAAPAWWCEHDVLTVDGAEVAWWVSGPIAGDVARADSGRGEASAAGAGNVGGPGAGERPRVHAATLDGLARGLAWAAGAWDRRLAVADLLAEPDGLDGLLLDEAFTG